MRAGIHLPSCAVCLDLAPAVQALHHESGRPLHARLLCTTCLQAVGASGAAALRPALHKAASKGVNSVKRVTLESAEQSKKSLCLALLREVRRRQHQQQQQPGLMQQLLAAPAGGRAAVVAAGMSGSGRHLATHHQSL